MEVLTRLQSLFAFERSASAHLSTHRYLSERGGRWLRLEEIAPVARSEEHDYHQNQSALSIVAYRVFGPVPAGFRLRVVFGPVQ